jgi:starch synthase
VVFSIYKSSFSENLSKEKFLEKAPISSLIEKSHLNSYKDYNHIGLIKGGAAYADAVIVGSQELEKEVGKYLKSLDKPILDFTTAEGYLDKYADFYNTLSQ